MDKEKDRNMKENANLLRCQNDRKMCAHPSLGIFPKYFANIWKEKKEGETSYRLYHLLISQLSFFTQFFLSLHLYFSQKSKIIFSLIRFICVYASFLLSIWVNFFPSEETALARMSNIIITLGGKKTLRGKIEFEDTLFRYCRKAEKMLRFFFAQAKKKILCHQYRLIEI